MHRSSALFASLVLLCAACSTPPYRESLEGGLTLLDADRYDDARAHFESATDAAENDDEELLARALAIECWIGAGLREEAVPLVQELCAERPRSFLAWKCATALELRFGAFADAARAASAAASAASTEIEQRWAVEVQLLLHAWTAFRGGDVRAALRSLQGIEHAELAAAAAHLRSRAERVERELALRAQRAAERGAVEAARELAVASTAEAPLRRSLEAQRVEPVLDPTLFEPAGIAAVSARALLATPLPRLRVSRAPLPAASLTDAASITGWQPISDSNPR